MTVCYADRDRAVRLRWSEIVFTRDCHAISYEEYRALDPVFNYRLTCYYCYKIVYYLVLIPVIFPFKTNTFHFRKSSTT
jgi:hypothetical protein